MAAIREGRAEPVELWTRLQKWIRKVASRYTKDEDLIDDLMQESYFALLRAIELYQDDGRSSFVNYAAYWIRGRFANYVNTNGDIRLPLNVAVRVRSYNKMVSTFQRDYGRDPTEAEIVEAFGVGSEQLRRESMLTTTNSLDKPLTEESDDTFADVVEAPDDVEQTVLDKVNADELQTKLWELVDTLPEREASVVKMYYKDGLTQQQCGEALAITDSRVGVIRESALRKLRSRKITKQLEPYLDDLRYSWGVRRANWHNTGFSSTEYAAIKALDYLGKLKTDGLI